VAPGMPSVRDTTSLEACTFRTSPEMRSISDYQFRILMRFRKLFSHNPAKLVVGADGARSQASRGGCRKVSCAIHLRASPCMMYSAIGTVISVISCPCHSCSEAYPVKKLSRVRCSALRHAFLTLTTSRQKHVSRSLIVVMQWQLR
jgi:hypothetical protein